MLNLYSLSSKKNFKKEKLTEKEKLSVLYHDIFDYPLDFSELIKWSGGAKSNFAVQANIVSKSGYYFLEGKEGLIYKRTLRKRISERKLQKASKAAKTLSIIAGVRMVGVTGSLSMGNSVEDSDIDLMIVTREGTLWTTRLISYLVTWFFRIKTRRPGMKKQKDFLCLNIWMDESDLAWSKKDRNIYTAHEIAQIVPLINKDQTYERLILANKWILGYWPNAIRVQSTKYRVQSKNFLSTMYYVLISPLELIARWIQYQYMRPKLTRETVTKTRALFHPQDWSKVVKIRLK